MLVAVHIVKLSGLGTALDSPLRSGRWHAQTERHIADAGLPFTYLHPPFFMQNLLRSAAVIAAQGVLVASMQAGKIAMVDARDVAAVAVAALTSDGHVGKTYTITGPEALSFQEVAQKLAAATGRPVTYQDVPLATVRQEMVAAGLPDVACGGTHGVCDGPAGRLRCGGHGHGPGSHRAASADL